MEKTYTHGLDEGETQNGVGEELATEGGVAGDGGEEGREDEADTDTGTTETDGGGAHADVLRDLDEGVGHLGGVGTAAGQLGGVEEGGGALHGVEGGVLAGGDCAGASRQRIVHDGGRRRAMEGVLGVNGCSPE